MRIFKNRHIIRLLHFGVAFAILSMGAFKAPIILDLIVKNSPWKDVQAYGLAATNATIQAAIDNAAAGDTVFVPKSFGPYTLQDNVTIGKPLRFVSNGAVLNLAGGKRGIVIASGNVDVEGFEIVGDGQSPLDYNEAGIYLAGTAAAPYKNIRIRDNGISDVSGWAMFLRNLEDFDISGNRVSRVDYGGIVVLSGVRGAISRNLVDNVLSSTGNGYPIEITVDGENSADPMSTDISVVANQVRNNPGWKCYGAHAGKRISFVGNTGYNCKLGISVGSADNTDNLPQWAPKDITIAGNVLDSGKTDGTANYGINLSGAYNGSVIDYATGAVSGNITRGYGYGTDQASAALFFYATKGLAVSGNVTLEPSPNAINLYHNNIGFAVTGNSVVDVWSDNATTNAFYVQSVNQTGTLSGNVLSRGSKTAAKVNEYGFRSGLLSGVSVQLGTNDFEAATVAKYAAYAGSAHGISYTASTTWDPPSVANASTTSTSVTVTGAQVGDHAGCALSSLNSTAGIFLSGKVTAADTVYCVISNLSGGALDLSSGTLYVKTERQ